MTEKVLKMNRAFLKNPKKVFVLLLFLIFSLIISSIYLLFATFSYKYAIDKNSKELNLLLVKNSKLNIENLNLEWERYQKEINKDLVLSNNIKYLRTNENLAMNYQR